MLTGFLAWDERSIAFCALLMFSWCNSVTNVSICPLSDCQPDRGDGPLQCHQHHLWLWPLFTGRVHCPQTTELPGGDGHVTGSGKPRGETGVWMAKAEVDFPPDPLFLKEGTGSHICRSCLTWPDWTVEHLPDKQKHTNKHKHTRRRVTFGWCSGGNWRKKVWKGWGGGGRAE